MSWHDSDSPWRRRMKQRVAGSKSVVILPVVVTVAAGVSIRMGGTAFRTVAASLSFTLVLGLAIPALMLLVSIVLSVQKARAQSRILRDVPKYDGHLCPGCLTPLSQEVAEHNCPKCDRHYELDTLQAYWVDYVFEPMRLGTYAAPGSLRAKLAKLQASPRKSLTLHFALVLAVVVAILLLMWRFLGVSATIPFFRSAPFFLGMGLFGVATRALMHAKRRTGRSRHCIACGYQQSPDGIQPGCCPECGADWVQAGGIITGKRADKSPYIPLAVGLYALAGLVVAISFAPSFLGAKEILKLLPTGSVIRETILARSFATDEWAELAIRQLTSEQHERLAVGLLNKRLRNKYIASDAGGWMWTQVSTEKLPKKLVERYYREIFDAWIEAPDAGRVGTPLRLAIGSTFRYSSRPSGIRDVIYFGGFFVGDDLTPVARADEDVYAVLIDEPEYSIETDITPRHGGPLRVRAVLYFAVDPTSAAAPRPSLQWQQDGAVILPAAVLWSHRIEVEKTIQISE